MILYLRIFKKWLYIITYIKINYGLIKNLKGEF